MLLDQYNDPQHKMLYGIQFEFDAPTVDAVKTASLGLDSRDALSYTAFADQHHRLFPINSPENALLSACYATKQASAIDQVVMKRIANALDMYGLPWPTAIKTASEADEVVGDYVLPDLQRLLVKGAEDVRRADHKLQQDLVGATVAVKAAAFSNLVKIAAKHDMGTEDVSEAALKYAGLATCEIGPLLDQLDARRSMIDPTGFAYESYEKIAHQVTAEARRMRGYYEEPGQLADMVTAISALDKIAGLDAFYDRGILDPLLTVHNCTYKLAAQSVAVGDVSVPLAEMVAFPMSMYQNAFGEEIKSEISDEAGNIDPTKVMMIIPTMPRDSQKLFLQMVNK